MIDTTEQAPEMREMHNYAPWVNVLVGLAVFTLRFASPRGTFSVHWNLFITGIVIMIAAFATTIAHGQIRRNYWSAINLLAGVWLIWSVNAIPSIAEVTTGQIALGVAAIICGIASLAGEIVCERAGARKNGAGTGHHQLPI